MLQTPIYHNYIPDDPLRILEDNILKLRKRFNVEKGKHDFIDALDTLQKDLHTQIKHYKKCNAVGKFFSSTTKNEAMAIAKATNELLKGLANLKPAESEVEEEPNEEEKLNVGGATLNDIKILFEDYENKCKEQTGMWIRIGKRILAVILTGIFCTAFALLGAALIGGLGFFLGVWAGPGALVTGVAGLFTGTFSGWATAFLVVSCLLGTYGAYKGANLSLSSLKLFSDTPIEKDIKQVTELGKEYFMPASVLNLKDHEQLNLLRNAFLAPESEDLSL